MKFNSIFLKMLTVGLFFSNSVYFGMNEFTLGLGETAADAEAFNNYNFQRAVAQAAEVVDQDDFDVNFKKINALLAAPGVDVNAASKTGITALILAVGRDYPDMVKLLLAKPGINVNAADYIDRYTALTLAAQFGKTDIVRQLLAIPEINVNYAIGYNGKTALMLAVDEGNTDIVNLLLAMPGINVNATDNNGRTALMHAALSLYRSIDMVKLLLAKLDINVNAVNNAGDTALMWFAGYYGDIDIVNLLLAKPGINVNAVNDDGKTALMLAVVYGHIDTALALLDAGAEVTQEIVNAAPAESRLRAILQDALD